MDWHGKPESKKISKFMFYSNANSEMIHNILMLLRIWVGEFLPLNKSYFIKYICWKAFHFT